MEKTKPNMLLHVCCAPCSTWAIERLKNEYNVTLFFYNPNIHPEEEYNKRLENAKRIAHLLELELIELCYDAEKWHRSVKGLENEPEHGRRCALCFELRLGKAAEFAKKHNFDIFTTTLTVSPHKNHQVINNAGMKLGKEFNVEFLEANFKKQDGYKMSIHLSKKYDLYRQKYCGCVYSLHNIK